MPHSLPIFADIAAYSTSPCPPAADGRQDSHLTVGDGLIPDGRPFDGFLASYS